MSFWGNFIGRYIGRQMDASDPRYNRGYRDGHIIGYKEGYYRATEDLKTLAKERIDNVANKLEKEFRKEFCENITLIREFDSGIDVESGVPCFKVRIYSTPNVEFAKYFSIERRW